MSSEFEYFVSKLSRSRSLYPLMNPTSAAALVNAKIKLSRRVNPGE